MYDKMGLKLTLYLHLNKVQFYCNQFKDRGERVACSGTAEEETCSLESLVQLPDSQ